MNYINGYNLDKDIKINENKVYSPEVCMFVSASENAIEARAKTHESTSPDGDIVSIYNLNEFCRCNGLDSSTMAKVKSSKIKSHKGWKRAAL